MGTNIVEYEYVAWRARRGTFPQWERDDKLDSTGSMEIQRMRHHEITTCTKNMYILPIQNILRISKVRTGTWGHTMD